MLALAAAVVKTTPCVVQRGWRQPNRTAYSISLPA